MLRTSRSRWTTNERDQHIATAPPFGHLPPSSEKLADLVRRYVALTGDPIRPEAPKKRNLLAACYRVHGDDVMAVLAHEFVASGTAINLLGKIRRQPPRRPDPVLVGAADGERPSVAPVPPDPTSRSSAAAIAEAGPASTIEAGRERAPEAHPGDCGCPEADVLPSLIYCAAHRPLFGGTSKRRWDRTSANPDAARFFPQEPPLAAGAPPR